MKDLLFVCSAIFLSAILVSCADSDNGNGNNSGPSNLARYFKAASGPGNEYFPAVGLRSFDNQTTLYTFWRPCPGEFDVSVRLHTGTNNEPIDWSKLYGPSYNSSTGCKIDAKLDYSSGTLIIGGTFKSNTLNVRMQEITRDEFIDLLASDEVGFTSKYEALSSFDQFNYDNACEDLFGSTCTDVFK